MATSCTIYYTCVSLTLTTLLCLCGAQQPPFFTPPPGEGYPRPTVINGIVYNLFHIPKICQDPRVYNYPTGGLIEDARALMQNESPHKIAGNINIAPSGCLYIEPGSILHFAPGYGLRVNGTLIAWGSPGERIVMTKDPDKTSGQSAPWPDGSRLVDGNTTLDGRFELKYHGKWRGVCTNYINFTKTDANVTCRSMGFLHGNFTYHSFAKNVSDYILYERPACKGTENDLFNCPGQASITMGKHVCDGQQVIGFKCAGFRPDMALDHWRGIEFLNSTTAGVYMDQGLILRNLSLSRIEYADISYAGVDIMRDASKEIRHPMATISANPHAPNINEITLTYGAHDGLNFTDIAGPISIANSTISHNRGHGMLVQTTVGRMLVNTTNVTNNWGDGIKFHMINYTITRYEDKFPQTGSFCAAIVPERALPAFVYQDLKDFNGESPLPGRSCFQRMLTSVNRTITVHFLLFERDPAASATLKLYDGRNGPLLQSVEILNGSYPESVTTTGNEIYMELQHKLPLNRQCPDYKFCLRFLLEVTAEHGPDQEFQLINSSVSNNSMHGVNIHDMRSKVFFNTTEVSFNQYEAGIRIFQGAGEICINNTLIEKNSLAGVNITYSGGYILFNNTRLLENYGYGVITEYDIVNKTRYEFRQKMEVVRSVFEMNEWTAFRIGNYCKESNVLVNESRFAYNFEEGIEFLSCNRSNSFNTNFSLAFNEFHSNQRHSILIAPMLYVTGILTNNTFSGHQMGVLRFDNGRNLFLSRWYTKFPVNYKIFENDFEDNSGRYVVNFCLTNTSPLQKLLFKFNTLRDNYINETFQNLKPRGRANAVVVLSSGGVVFEKNFIVNPESVREVATHLTDPSITIHAQFNWWGVDDPEQIYNKIFDRDDRYNLAFIEYYPNLAFDRLYENHTTLIPRHIWQFNRGNIIGGVLENGFQTDPNIKEYFVDRDIYVRPGALLEIRPGTTLYFENSLGMITYGRLIADGQTSRDGVQPLLFTMNETEIVVENVTATVRLEDGFDQFEGRLEVEIDGVWGTVCKEGWTEESASLACQQLGLTYNPKYAVPRRRIIGRYDQPVHMADVHCDEMDLDIVNCKANFLSDISPGYCNHSQDVIIRCHPPTWSGITIPGVPKGSQQYETNIRHLIIQKAGLFDAATMEYSPSLRIDYNYHVITNLTVEDGVSDGIDIKFTHPVSENRLEYCRIVNNLGSGVVTRDTALEVAHSIIDGNGEAGLRYDPSFTEMEIMTIRNAIHPDHRVDMLKRTSVVIGEDSMVFLVSTPTPSLPNGVHVLQLDAGQGYRTTLQILDFNPNTKREKVTVFDSQPNSITWQTPRWGIEDDLVDFPVTASSRYLTIRIEAPGIVSERLTFVAHSKRYISLKTRLYVRNCTFTNNVKGIVTNHYNNPSNYKQDVFFRHKHEVFEFDIVKISRSKEEAMHIPSVTKYGENDLPSFEEMTRPQKVAVIDYILNYCQITDNAFGVVAEHNHVDFANNVWHWKVDHCKINNNNGGGFEMELPRVNDRLERETHGFQMESTEFKNNKNFAFAINGYYANVSIRLNSFQDNICRLGLVSISGMEKHMTFSQNLITGNTGRYMVDFDMDSHSEYNEFVVVQFHRNDVRRNLPDSQQQTGNQPHTYAVAFRGVINVTANRNLIDNNLQYELVAGVTALSLDNKMNVAENWWGSRIQLEIKQRIFDFDDWNNFAIAEYTPFLDSDQLDAQLIPGSDIDKEPNPDRLGGRFLTDYTIPTRTEPYIVESDMTVMPNAMLTISPGVELQFQPNVGILVLGILEARGLPYGRIKMGPVKKAIANNSGRRRREISHSLRLTGGLTDDEGFLELYNSTSKSYNLMCDSQFNEKTAEVVCRELGKETINVQVRFSHLYDHYVYGRPMFFRKEFWANSFYCKGNENNLNQCKKRINYNLLPCVFAANYTFVRCGKRNLPEQYDYWGNIRFAPPSYEESSVSIDDPNRKRSRIENVDIMGAGILHGEKVGAIQATYLAPKLDNMNVTHCASNALDFIAPRENLLASTLNITDNLGYGLNVLVLNGKLDDSPVSTFQPLLTSSIPYNSFGMVEICRMEKRIFIQERLILFYKYNHRTIDCVKIITSSSPLNRVSLRFLQLNLYNDTFSRNTIEIFDGLQVSNETMLAEITADSPPDAALKSYTTTTDERTLAVHIHASPGQWTYGFIAEVVTLPQSGHSYPDSKFEHRVQNSEIKKNQDGAVLYRNVGEVTPSLYIERCWVEDNGIAILNLTSWPTIDIGIQGIHMMRFKNNFINGNRGGVQLVALKSGSTKANITLTNNLFSLTTNGEALNVSGHRYQEIYVYENDFFNNTAGDWRNVINFEEVMVNFTQNLITNNYGHHVLAAMNAEGVSIQQEYTKNIFSENNASAEYAATIFAGKGNPLIVQNYLVNPLSSFELLAGNTVTLPNGRILSSQLNASYNWWGSPVGSFIRGKIWEKDDDERLRPVLFFPSKPDNISFLEGKCPPGWRREDELCYRYLGGSLNYKAARAFCTEQGGYLAITRDRLRFLNNVVKTSQAEYSEDMKVWVYGDVSPDRCSSLRGIYTVEEEDCERMMLPFICERDPYIAPPGTTLASLALGLGIGLASAVLLIVIILGILWYIKSKRRKRERFERRESIRSSVRSAKSKASLAGLSERGPTLQNRSRSVDTISVQGPRGVYITGVTSAETSTETLDKTRLDDYYLDRSNPSLPGSKRDLYNRRTDHYINAAYYNGGSTDNMEYDDEEEDEDEFDEEDDDDVSQKASDTTSTNNVNDNYRAQAPPPYQFMPPALENEISSLRRTPVDPRSHSNTSIEDKSVDLSSNNSKSGVSLQTFGSRDSMPRPPAYQRDPPDNLDGSMTHAASQGSLQNRAIGSFSPAITDPSQKQASLPSVMPLYRRREMEINRNKLGTPPPPPQQYRSSPGPLDSQTRRSPAPNMPPNWRPGAQYQQNSPTPYQPSGRNSPSQYQPPNRNSPTPYLPSSSSPATHRLYERNSPAPYQYSRNSPAPYQPPSRNSPALNHQPSRSSPELHQQQDVPPETYQPRNRNSYKMSSMDPLTEDAMSYNAPLRPSSEHFQEVPSSSPMDYEELDREPFSGLRGRSNPSQVPTRRSPEPKQPLETSM